MKIGLLNGGGDCPGLNAVTYGVVGAANRLGWEVIGFVDGYEGLLSPGNYKVLDPIRVLGIQKLGGTIIGTTNRGSFSGKEGAGGVRKIPAELMDEARATLNELGVEALVCVGGDGTLTTALQFSEEGTPVVGVPKTIDNDLSATAMTFGFDSATQVVVDALDRLHTTASSHKRVMVLEVMGRHAGWIALYGGFGGGAEIILLPEIPFTYESVARAIDRLEEQGKTSTLIVIAEGAAPEGEDQVIEENESDEGGEFRLGGIGERAAKEIGKLSGREVRSVTLGHLQRGGSPTSWDRVLATRFGVQAVKLIEERKFGRMVNYQHYEVGDVSIREAVEELKVVDPKGQLVETARSVGISFGD